MKCKKILGIFIAAIISITFSLVFEMSASAAGSANFNVPKNAVDQDETFSVVIKFSADSEIGFVNGMLTYDDNILDFQPSDFVSGGGGLLTLNAFPDSPSDNMSIKVEFKGKDSGRSKIELSNCHITSGEGTEIGSPTAYGYVTVSEHKAQSVEGSVESNDSSDADKIGDPNKGYLTSLTVSQGVLKPDFSYDIYDYTVDVDNDVDFLEIEGKTANATDKIWYTGNEDLIVGKNVRTVKVTDAQGYNHVYTITINRAESSNTSVVNSSADDENNAEIESSTSTAEAPVIIDSDDNTAMDKNKGIITTGLIIVLVTLIIALVVVIVWLKRKKKSNK